MTTRIGRPYRERTKDQQREAYIFTIVKRVDALEAKKKG